MDLTRSIAAPGKECAEAIPSAPIDLEEGCAPARSRSATTEAPFRVRVDLILRGDGKKRTTHQELFVVKGR